MRMTTRRLALRRVWCVCTAVVVVWYSAVDAELKVSVGEFDHSDATASAALPRSLDRRGWLSVSDDSHETSEAPNNDEEDIRDEDLFAWAARQSILSHSRPSPAPHCIDCFLVVGIKTRAVRGFQARQIIRASWADPAITHRLHTRVVFLGCEPDWSQEQDANATRHALALEKESFGDLLTSELGGCVDSYERLVSKILGFFPWVVRNHPRMPYLMMGDDDVFMRLDRVVAMLQDAATPQARYYAGQIPSIREGQLMPTVRDRWHKNYMSTDVYPMSNHVPRANGPHYILSRDLVRFLARNSLMLRGTGPNDDLSVGLWLCVFLQVRPVNVPAFDSMFAKLCSNSLASFSDLSAVAMRQIHRNVKRGRSFCHGYSWWPWANPNARGLVYQKLRPRSDVSYTWNVRFTNPTRMLQLDILVSLMYPDSPTPVTLLHIKYTASLHKAELLCKQLEEVSTKQLDRKLPPLLCVDLCDQLDAYLERDPPTVTSLLALTRANLRPLGRVALNVWVSRTVLRWRAFFECILIATFPGLHVFLLDELSDPSPIRQFDPDVVVVTNREEYISLPHLPPSCRVIVLAIGPLVERVVSAIAHDTPAILITSNRLLGELLDKDRRPVLYVPVASLVFADSMRHTPLELLESSSTRYADFSPVATFAIPLCNARLVQLLDHMSFQTQSQITCPTGQDPHQTNVTDNQLFLVDADVTTCARFKFVLAVETDQTTSPGRVADAIVSAFLAGSIPIYDGDDATVSRLFNPKAFVSCQQFASLQHCAEFVMQLHESPAMYEAMRNEPPVVNETAFYEAFSWHPDVLRRLSEREDMEMQKRVSMVERMKELLL